MDTHVPLCTPRSASRRRSTSPARRARLDYVTAPALWATWHPATVDVRDVPARPITTGESSGGGDRSRRPSRAGALDRGSVHPAIVLAVATDTPDGTARIEYHLAAAPRGTRFRRVLAFRSKRLPWRLLDTTFTRWMLERQSRKALRNLVVVLTASPVQATLQRQP